MSVYVHVVFRKYSAEAQLREDTLKGSSLSCFMYGILF